MVLSNVVLAVAFAGSKKEKIEVTKEKGLLQQVKERGYVICGVNVALHFLQDENGNWSGLDVDFCKAVLHIW